MLDDLFDYCFPILDKIGHKLDSLEDDVFEGRSDEVVRDISNVKQEIISYRKIIKPERSTLRLLERHVERFLPEELELYFDDIVDAAERIWDILDNYKEVVEALEDTNESVISPPPERRPARPDGLLGRAAAADADHRHLRHERALPRLRDGVWAFWVDLRRRWSSRWSGCSRSSATSAGSEMAGQHDAGSGRPGGSSTSSDADEADAASSASRETELVVHRGEPRSW